MGSPETSTEVVDHVIVALETPVDPADTVTEATQSSDHKDLQPMPPFVNEMGSPSPGVENNQQPSDWQAPYKVPTFPV